MAIEQRACGPPRGAAGPRSSAVRARDLRREGPGHGVPADRAAAAAGGRAERAGRPARRRRLRRVERVRRAVRDAERGAARGRRAEVQPLPHDGAVLADARGAADRPQPPHRRHGRHHRDRHVGARLQLDAAEHVRAAGRDRSSSTATRRRSSASATRCRCGRRARWARSTTGRPGSGFEYFYGFIGGEANQYYPALYEGTTPVEPRAHARGGLPPHGRHDRQGDRLGPPAEVADARQAVLRLLRARRDARAAPRAAGVGGQVQGPVRRRLGRAARADLRAAEGARRDPAGRRADARATTRSRPGTTCRRS